MESPSNTLKFGNFEILKNENGANIELGRGSYGVTYKANHLYLRKVVALKVIHERHMENADATQRFLNEAQIVASLDHRNIARVFDFGEHDGIFFYAMDFCDGGNLENLSTNHGPLSWSAIVPLARQIAEALECAHSAGLLHRDIKPSNLMLVGANDPKVVKLIDFGLVKVLDSSEKSSTFQMLSRDGGFIGNPMSAAPEQLLEEDIDARADLFSLGITLWYLLLAKSPFEGISSAKLVHERLSDKPYELEKLPGLNDHGRAILTKLIAKNPEDRFTNAGELIQALDDPSFGQIIDQEKAVTSPVVISAPDDAPPANWVIPQPDVASFDGLRIIRRISSNSKGMAALVEHACGSALIIVHPHVQSLISPTSSDQILEQGTYGGEQALLIRGITDASWENMHHLGQESSKSDLFSWFAQMARSVDLFRSAGFEEFDFRPSNIFPVVNPLRTSSGGTQWIVFPRFEEHDGKQDAWNSIGGESLAPTSLSAFVALIYRTLSGMRLKPAAFIKETAYVKSPNLSETGNHLIASTLCASKELVTNTNYVDFIIELSHYEQIGIAEITAPPPALLGSQTIGETSVLALKPLNVPSPPIQESRFIPVLTTDARATHQIANDHQISLPAPEILPSVSSSPNMPDPPSELPRVANAEAKATSRAGGKNIKVLSAVAAALVLSGTAAVLLPQKSVQNEQPTQHTQETPTETTAAPPITPPPSPRVTQPRVEYREINLSSVPWLVPGAEFTLFNKRNVAVAMFPPIPESSSRLFTLPGSFTEDEWKKSAPYRLEIRHRSADQCDLNIRVEGIDAPRFGTEKTSSCLNLENEKKDLTASIKGWFSPKFIPTIEPDTSAFNKKLPITVSKDDPITHTIHYQTGTGEKTSTSTDSNNDGKFEFDLSGATSSPVWFMSSKLFSKEIVIPLQASATVEKVSLNVAEVTADPNRIGVLLDGIILKPTSVAKTPLWERIREHIPILTPQNLKAHVIKEENYSAVISNGPLDGLEVAQVKAYVNLAIDLPTFNTGYAFAVNHNMPYRNFDGNTKPIPAFYLLSMPKDEPWRVVIICCQKEIKDGKGFIWSEAIMQVRKFDPIAKRIHFLLDYKGQPYRIVEVNLSKVFESGTSIDLYTNWTTKENNSDNWEFSFPAIANTIGKDQVDYPCGFSGANSFVSTKNEKTFIKNINNYLSRWAIKGNSNQNLSEEEIRKQIPKEATLLGKEIFDTDYFRKNKSTTSGGK